jgi:hypothetical protein
MPKLRRAHEELVFEVHGLDPVRGIAALRVGAKLPGERRKTADSVDDEQRDP